MSSLIVEVTEINSVHPHPNADALELAQLKGWQVCVPKGRYRAGERVVYIPIDAVLPAELSDRLGITKYLSNGRVRCARLRGEPSFGVTMDCEEPWDVGTDVAARYGITSYVPPLRPLVGDAEPEHPLFFRYTEIENLRHFPEVLREGEPVVVTEKIHGTNSRVGFVEGQLVCGSKGTQWKRPEDPFRSPYWFPGVLPGVRSLLEHYSSYGCRQAILFGETFGSKVQSLHYGCEGRFGYRAFDLLVDGKYLDYPDFRLACDRHGVEMAPLVDEGEFSLERIRGFAEGTTLVDDATHLREGVVVKPQRERIDPKVGRVILKYVGDGYLFGKHVSDTEDR